MLSRQEILNRKDIEFKEVDVPEWEGTVRIRQMTRGEQDAYLKRQMGDARMRTEKKQSVGEIAAASMFGHDAFVVACGLVDENGANLFSASNPKDLQILCDKNGAVIGRLATEIVKFSGMANDLPLEEEAKN